jgi:exosome complex component CSL4
VKKLTESETEIKAGDLVLPGQKIGVIEMYVPGLGTYTKDGIIFSSIIGEFHVDSSHVVSVVSKEKKPLIPKNDDIVIGVVDMVRKQMAIANITNVRGFNPKTDFEGMIHISQVSKNYLENLSDAFKTGDVIRAVVINDEVIPYFLNTAAPHLGVILSYCSECGQFLQLDKDGRNLFCNKCKIIEKRKTARDYGKFNL